MTWELTKHRHTKPCTGRERCARATSGSVGHELLLSWTHELTVALLQLREKVHALEREKAEATAAAAQVRCVQVRQLRRHILTGHGVGEEKE